MNPLPTALFQAVQIPRPDPVPLAGPFWLFSVLLLLVFLLHVLPMNFVLGGSILAAISKLRGRRLASSHHLQLSQLLSRLLPVVIAFAITFGVAALLFVQILYGRLLYTSSILLGWYWFAVIPILILAYYAAYYVTFRAEIVGLRGVILSSLAAALFLVIAFIYTNNMSLMLRPEAFLEKYLAQNGGPALNLDDPTLIPRYLHMLLGAVAVTGLFTALIGLVKRQEEREFADWAARYGLLLFAGATALNVLVGAWFLLSYSRDNLLQFMQKGPLGPTALAFGVSFGLLALGCGLFSLQVRNPGSLIKGAAAAVLVTLVSMILVRDQMREAILSTVYSPVDWKVPQWNLIALFLVLFAASLLTIGWMLRRVIHK